MVDPSSPNKLSSTRPPHSKWFRIHIESKSMQILGIPPILGIISVSEKITPSLGNFPKFGEISLAKKHVLTNHFYFKCLEWI